MHEAPPLTIDVCSFGKHEGCKRSGVGLKNSSFSSICEEDGKAGK